MARSLAFRRRRIVGAALVFTLTGAGSITPAAAQTPSAPRCDGPEYRAFDFWLGVWDVATPKGATAGVNEITAEENGCLIVERWRGAGGSTGQSYNYIDPSTNEWRQIWVSNAFTIDYAGGLDEAGAMVLEGKIAYRANGQTAPFRGKWVLRDDGAVEQSFHQFNPETEEWTPWFTGIYTKRTAPGE